MKTTNYFIGYGRAFIHYFVLKRTKTELVCYSVTKSKYVGVYEINSRYTHYIPHDYAETFTIYYLNDKKGVVMNNTGIRLNHPRIINKGKQEMDRYEQIKENCEHDYKHGKVSEEYYRNFPDMYNYFKIGLDKEQEYRDTSNYY